MKFAYFGFDVLSPCLDMLLQNGHELMQLFTFFSDNDYDYNQRVLNYSTAVNAPIIFAKPRPEDLQNLADRGCEIFISAAYAYKIPPLPEGTYGFNVHPTMLPIGRGRFPLPYVMLHHRNAAGITIHKIAPEMDAGDILLQKKLEVFDSDDLETLSCRVVRETPSMVLDAVNNIESYWNNAQKQDAGKAQYWPFPPDSMRTVFWDMTVDEINKIGKAFSRAGWFAEIEGAPYIISRYTAWKEPHNLPPGTLSAVLDRELAIAAKDGFVCVKEYAPHYAQGQ